MLLRFVLCISILICSVKSAFQIPMLNIVEPKLNFDHISDRCKHHFDGLVKGGLLMNMLDANSKLPPGVLTGNIVDHGNFDECISIEHKLDDGDTVFGKYCARSVVIPLNSDLKMQLSACIPSGCQLTELIPQNQSFVFGSDQICQTKETGMEWDTGDYVMASVLGIIACLIIINTIYDMYLYKYEKKTFHPLFIAFSLLTNGSKLFAVNESTPNQLNCLNGLRFISMLWVIMGHRFVSTLGMPIMNLQDAPKWQNDDLYSFYVQSARVAVDTFFLLSGLLISYGYFKSLKKNPMTVRHIPTYYLHRFLRVTPALAAMYCIHITLLRHMGSGPIWPFLFNMTRTTCLKHWWSFFLYIQNYVNYQDMCIVPTWYLSADMQMFAISPFVILPLGYFTLKNKSKLAYIFTAGLIIGAMIIPMIIDLFVDDLNEYDTHTRLSVWLIGILMGMFIYHVQNNKQPEMNQILNLVIWIIVLAVMITIVLCMPGVRNNPTFIKTNMFNTFSRPAWCFGLCWIIYSCTTGNGGIVNWILSRPIYQVMCRLSYSMYLLHNPIITITIAKQRTTIYFDDYAILYTWCGDVIFTTLLSVVWVLAFESPMISIEKVIFGKKPTKKMKIEESRGETVKEVA